jgi:CHASE3 domain sensor protein
MTVDETAETPSQSKTASGSLLGFIIFLALVLGGIQYVSTQLISYYAQTQVCQGYARAKTDELESLVTQYKDCLTEFYR